MAKTDWVQYYTCAVYVSQMGQWSALLFRTFDDEYRCVVRRQEPWITAPPIGHPLEKQGDRLAGANG